MKNIEKNIAQMQHTLDNPPKLDDQAALNEELVCPSCLFRDALLVSDLRAVDWSI